MANASERGFRVALALAAALGLVAPVGCLRHGAALQARSFRLEALSDVTVLQPPQPGEVQGVSQTTVVRLGRGSAAAGEDCAIAGEMFALRPAEGEGGWRMRSPSASGWDTAAVQTDAEQQWTMFRRALAARVAAGCFPAGVGVSSVQHEIVEAIPVPANMVLGYYYSLTSTGFIALQPGMQLGIELLSAATPGTSRTVHFAVVDRPPTGVALELLREGGGKTTAAEAEVATLPQRFAALPYLRLFLQRSGTGTEEAREAMLLGAKTLPEMDAASATIVREGEASCNGDRGATRCEVFRGSGVSLLTEITVNGRTMFYAPGTTLSQLMDPVAEARRKRAFATLTVKRRTAAGYVPVEVPRTDEGRFNLLLLSGDEIRWR